MRRKMQPGEETSEMRSKITRNTRRYRGGVSASQRYAENVRNGRVSARASSTAEKRPLKDALQEERGTRVLRVKTDALVK
ncbi:hypothetical protein NDU88_009749 [Pleurodeles waltl]|uniref:Uncharacterized protein n=1 Tax=Pleurodeles waltl TaxID=8319 RepID=A0AAV7QW76_PLEWA|nr:hypothetical protein NDU88_009749 [Pleurodeles waltl]